MSKCRESKYRSNTQPPSPFRVSHRILFCSMCSVPKSPALSNTLSRSRLPPNPASRPPCPTTRANHVPRYKSHTPVPPARPTSRHSVPTHAPSAGRLTTTVSTAKNGTVTNHGASLPWSHFPSLAGPERGAMRAGWRYAFLDGRMHYAWLDTGQAAKRPLSVLFYHSG